MDDELTLLAKKYGTDKAESHFYTQHYHTHFAHRRQEQLQVLEIGIGGYEDPYSGGESLRMWRDYFPNSSIWGMDLNPKIINENRITAFHGNQADPLSVAALLTATGGRPFDIIIDDGSHANEHVITSFLMLFQHLSPNGIYVVEDVQTSYWARCAGNSSDLETGLTSMSFFKKLLDGLNWQEIHRPGYSSTLYDRSIVGMFFYHNMIFIQKGVNNEGSNHVIDNVVPGQ